MPNELLTGSAASESNPHLRETGHDRPAHPAREPADPKGPAARPEQLFGPELQNIVVESIYLTKIKDSVDRKALSEITSLQEIIDRQLTD